VSAQFVALLTDDLWKRNAEHANAMARRLADGVEGVPGVTVTDTVAANAVFAILPPEVSLIPLFRVMAETGLYNTYFALILPNVAFGLPFTTFLIRAYMTGIPGELREAALMDGAGEARIFREVYLPLCRPILASAGLISAMRVWNEFIFALTFVESESVKTVTIGVMSFAVALRADWGVLMAGLALSILPILATFLVMQRQFVGGLTSGAVK
jgi:raffinose/stachyose/melibiose transport system permease protein